MRPVRLTLQAFGPYPKRVVIDFRDAVEAGLFGIYGQTGSGKSTLFSAMSFALFGEPAKPEQDAPSLRSDHADADILTEVEFVFDVGARRHVVVRSPEQMRPKTRGEGETRSAHEAYLFDATGLAPNEITETQRGKIIAEKKVRDVDTTIVEMLGYGSEQFRQIVLLPQGRFETFLSAKTKERLEILRELFDVSRYEALMDDLKSEADAAERDVRTERELCARRLSAEGFESTDALVSGIDTANENLATHQAAEDAAKTTAQASERELRQADAIQEKFAAAEKTSRKLAELEVGKTEIEALAEQVRQAEHARSLLDPEERTKDAAREVREAETALRVASEAVESSKRDAEIAAETLKDEESRSAETEALRKQKDDLQRFDSVLETSADSEQVVESAMAAQREANRALETARMQLTALQQTRTEKSAALKVARDAQTRRTEIMGRRTDLATRHGLAASYETAKQEVQTVQTDVDQQSRICEDASQRATTARQTFEAAEQDLADAQAFHLATKLEAGSPCPVCGALEHPSPASGDIAHAGLDQAFRDARQAWQTADHALRKETETLAVLQARLSDRRQKLDGLDEPIEPADTLQEKIAQEDAALAALGPEIDIAAAEAGIEGLDKQIAALERTRGTLRDTFETCRNKTTEAITARDGRLAEIPEDLRTPSALAAAQDQISRKLNERIAAKAAAEQAVMKTREAALGATKEHESAGNALATCRERHRKAQDTFQSRLTEAGLTIETFQSLKPAIAILDTDRERVETFWREHKSAEDAAKLAATAIDGVTRPDLEALRLAHEATTQALGKATEARVGARARVDQLTKLKAELEETLRTLDEAEAASGPLRALAALVNGHNPQRLTLETFAIGTMFDQVLEAANLRLDPMTSGRYRLERDLDGTGRGSRGLGIQVFDMHTGKPRATTTLSGGETFIAALALALGLADVVESASGKVQLDTIFIDEGFGSLDTENGSGTLDQVLQVLNSLVSQNRAVGLISHVPLVQEAIPNGFYVRKTMTGSDIETRGLM